MASFKFGRREAVRSHNESHEHVVKPACWSTENGHEGAESRNEALSLIDSGLALEPSHISNDMIDVPSRHTFDLRHVAELPMMSPYSAFCGPLKRDI